MNWSRIADPNSGVEVAVAPLGIRQSAPRAVDHLSTRTARLIEVCISFWQATHPPPIAKFGRCLECQEQLDQGCHTWLHVIIAPRRVAGLHADCHDAWQVRRRCEAVAALGLETTFSIAPSRGPTSN